MAHDAHIRAKALVLRRERQMTIDEIAERLAVSRTTIYYWVKDLPIERKRSPQSAAQRRRNASNSESFRLKRRAAYERGKDEFDGLADDPTFRDFICIYVGEGYKRHRNTISVANSDPVVVSLCSRWIERLAQNRVRYAIQYHADQDPDRLRAFWAFRLGIEPEVITTFRKSNSGQLARRNWRCRHGVISVNAYDTDLRSRLQAWLDITKRDWTAV